MPLPLLGLGVAAGGEFLKHRESKRRNKSDNDDEYLRLLKQVDPEAYIARIDERTKAEEVERNRRTLRRGSAAVAAAGLIGSLYVGTAAHLAAGAEAEGVKVVSEGETDRVVEDVQPIEPIAVNIFRTVTDNPEITAENPIKVGPFELPGELLTLRYENGIEADTIIWIKPEGDRNLHFQANHEAKQVTAQVPVDDLLYTTDLREEHNEGEVFVGQDGETYHNYLELIRAQHDLIGSWPIVGNATEWMTKFIGDNEDLETLRNDMRTNLDMSQIQEIEEICAPKVLNASGEMGEKVQAAFVKEIKKEAPRYEDYDMTVEFIPSENGSMSINPLNPYSSSQIDSGLRYASGIQDRRADSVCRVPEESDGDESSSGSEGMAL